MTNTLYRIATGMAGPLAPLLARILVRDPVERNERLGHHAALPAGAGGAPVWMHAASAGEMAGVEPVLEQLSIAPDPPPVVVSAVTRTGHARARGFAGATRVVFAPADFPQCVERAVDSLAPRLLMLFETELWPNLIRAARAGNVPVVIANGRITERSMKRMRRAGALYREAVCSLSLVGCQTEDDAARFLAWGVPEDRVFVHGNAKADQEAPDVPPPITGSPGERWVLFASVRPSEEPAVQEAIDIVSRALPAARFVIGPRHPDRSPLVRDAESRGYRLWSRRDRDAETNAGRSIVLDTIGDQVAFFPVTALAFIGGSLSEHGGHNPLEAARVGTPVLFGPHMQNCRDLADSLLANEAARVVRSGRELGETVLLLLNDDAARRALSENALRMFAENRGASTRLLHAVRERGLL